MEEIVEIPNYIGGEFLRSSEEKILIDHFGNQRAVMYNTQDSELRAAKRKIFKVKEKLEQVSIEKMIKIIKKSMEFYYTKEEDFEIISSLTGSPISFVKQSIAELKEWAKNIDHYISLCFGQKNYESIPIKTKEKTFGYTRYVPRGPIVGILPKNSEVEAAYLMIQILLSRNPGLIKTSSAAAGPISSIRYIEALNKAVDHFKDPKIAVVKEALYVVTIFNTNKEELVRKLEVQGATYVIFGSNETIQEVEKYLEESEYEEIIKMGTGLSVSVVLEDANLHQAAKEISSAASLNNGQDCISTNAVYISEKIYAKFLKILKQEAEKWKATSPLESHSFIGLIEQKVISDIQKKLDEMKRKTSLEHHEPGKVHLSLVEVEDHHSICEFPGPILLIRKTADEADCLKKLSEDFRRNDMKRNLATAVFTKSTKRFDQISRKIPSYIIKHNKGTEKNEHAT